jgi:arabinogalactan endo-1,4-beta-galactosidase
MFNPHGEALPSMYVFRLARPTSGSVFIPATVTEILPIALKAPVGAAPKLPATVKAVYSDDSVRDTPVTWEMPDPSAYQKEAQLVVQGTVDGTALKATANLTITSNINLVENPGFETGTLTPWTVSGDAAADVSKETGNTHAGTYAGHYWLDKPFAFTLSQTISRLDSGTYVLSAWMQGGGGEKTLQMFATCGGETLAVDVKNTGWQQWTQPTIDKIQVTGGTWTIGFRVAADAGVWGFIDEIELTRAK